MRLFLALAVVSSLFILYAFPFPALQMFAGFAVCFVALTTAMECNVTTSFTPIGTRAKSLQKQQLRVPDRSAAEAGLISTQGITQGVHAKRCIDILIFKTKM